MATISVPFNSGVIADGAIQERHLADGAVSLRAIDQTWPLIMRNQTLIGYYTANTRSVYSIALPRKCSRAMVVFTNGPAVYSASQPICGIAFNFGAVSVGLEHVNSALLPAVLATTDYREAMRLTSGSGEYLHPTTGAAGGPIFSTYSENGLYGWYNNMGQSASFASSDAAAKGLLESVWLDGMALRFAFRSNATSGGPWNINVMLNIYAI